MRVLFTRNIGAVDAARYGVPFGQCRAGDEADVGPDVSGELLARGLATEVAVAPPAIVPATAMETVVPLAPVAENKPIQKQKAGQKPAELHK